MRKNGDCQGGVTCGTIDEPRKFSKAIDERVIINVRDKNVIIARICDKMFFSSSASSSSDNSEQTPMDPHFILDIFTLCSVACLAVLIIVSKVLKGRRHTLSYQSKGSQTDNPVLNVDESINRLSSEMSTLQNHLGYLQQERLESVTTHRLQSFMPSKSEHSSEEAEAFLFY